MEVQADDIVWSVFGDEDIIYHVDCVTNVRVSNGEGVLIVCVGLHCDLNEFQVWLVSVVREQVRG